MEQIDHRAADLDETDLELLEYVETDFDMNLEQLSNELDLSKSAVHYRLNKFREKTSYRLRQRISIRSHVD